MVSLFPYLLSFSLLAPFIIRLFLGLYFLLYGTRLLRQAWRKEGGVERSACITGGIACVGAIFILAGFLTQGAATLLALLSLGAARQPGRRAASLLLFAMALSLVFSGAGFFAFDLPL